MSISHIYVHRIQLRKKKMKRISSIAKLHWNTLWTQWTIYFMLTAFRYVLFRSQFFIERRIEEGTLMKQAETSVSIEFFSSFLFIYFFFSTFLRDFVIQILPTDFFHFWWMLFNCFSSIAIWLSAFNE